MLLLFHMVGEILNPTTLAAIQTIILKFYFKNVDKTSQHICVADIYAHLIIIVLMCSQLRCSQVDQPH